MSKRVLVWAVLAFGAVSLVAPGDRRSATAQPPRRQPTPNDRLVSPEVHPDRKVTFRIYAPKASEVTLRGDWMEGGKPATLTKDKEGVWSVTVGPLVHDFYSYSFSVDGVRTLDPKNPTIKQGIASLDNMFFLRGKEAAFQDNRPVPHGEIRKVWYPSATLGTQRRMHVYTPPGYEGGKDRYPVLYLLHGGGDEDSGWSTVGRAGFILDNLLADRKARPMLVVMPNGSLPRPANFPAFRPGRPASPEFAAAMTALQERFTNELLKDIVPYVEKHYRVLKGREHRALAGLSMGGGQTLRVATTRPDSFAYLAVWSAGLFGGAAEFEKRNESFFKNAEKVNKAVKLFSISVGDKDFALAGSKALAALLKKHGIKHQLHVSGGGHTWINWRHYLHELAPRLFQDARDTSARRAAQPARGPRAPVIVSPEVKTDRQVVFRIHAPKAEAVGLFTTDIPGGFRPRPLKKGENGVWELTLGPVDPGTYRYLFNVDEVLTADPRNQVLSESNGNAWSVVHVPGSEFMDTTDVPHGAVARVYYRSSALGRTRRMHIYTPPGYEAGKDRYPVLYLLHGAGDSDDSWTSVGRANFILDNLIAARKAKPMVVVMPAGHTGPFSFIMPTAPAKDDRIGNAKFEEDFLKDMMPHVEKHYRALADHPNRAIAGLSMGGAQTLELAFSRPREFGYVGVFSSGVVFRKTADWEKERKDGLDAAARKGLKLLWFATGSEDFLLNRTKETVALFKKNGFKPVFKETPGGHTWINWQKYLNEFAPQLFR
jgi:enterochelin esterase family protein